ncbi:SDR family oxidoreductase [Rhodococcus sp. 3Y1]
MIHVSGYRVGGQDPTTVPWPDDHRTAVYKDLGAYEASKVESDAIFQARALKHGVPWTIVNPSSVIGDSATGESDQHIGWPAQSSRFGTAPQQRCLETNRRFSRSSRSTIWRPS